jgi:hypothetical protein
LVGWYAAVGNSGTKATLCARVNAPNCAIDLPLTR